MHPIPIPSPFLPLLSMRDSSEFCAGETVRHGNFVPSFYYGMSRSGAGEGQVGFRMVVGGVRGKRSHPSKAILRWLMRDGSMIKNEEKEREPASHW